MELEEHVASRSALLTKSELEATRFQAKIDEIGNVLRSQAEKIRDASAEYEKVKSLGEEEEKEIETLRYELSKLCEEEAELVQHSEFIRGEATAAHMAADKGGNVALGLATRVDDQHREAAMIEERLSLLWEEVEAAKLRIQAREAEKSELVSLIVEAKATLQGIQKEGKQLTAARDKADRTLQRRQEVMVHAVRAMEEYATKISEIEKETEHVTKEVAVNKDKLDGLIGRVIEKSEITLPRLSDALAKLTSEKDVVQAELLRVESQTTAIDTKTEALIEQTEKEKKTNQKILNQLSLAQQRLDEIREKTLVEISEKNAASTELKDLLKQYRQARQYQNEHEAELGRIEYQLEQKREERSVVETNFEQLTLKRNEFAADVAKQERIIRDLERVLEKLHKTNERLETKLDLQKRQIGVKKEKIREAELNDRSSDASLGLNGKVSGLQKNISITLEDLDTAQRRWMEQRESLLAIMDEVARESEKHENLRALVHVRENQKRRLLNDRKLRDADLKRTRKEISKLKFDIDKVGQLVIRFNEKIRDSKDRIECDAEVPAAGPASDLDRIACANDKVEREILSFRIEMETHEAERARLESEISVERQLQESLSVEVFDSAALERTVNRMKSQIADLRKQKDQLQKSMVRFVNKQEANEGKVLARTRKPRGSMSCSTLASTGSIGSSLEISGARVRAPGIGKEESILGQFQRVNDELLLRPLGVVTESDKDLVLIELDAWRRRLEEMGDSAPKKLLEWVVHNSKLLRSM